MKKRVMMALAALALGLAGGGCLSSPGGLTSSTVPITGKDAYTIIKSDATGGESSFGIISIPLRPCSAYDALQKAKKEYGADAFVNVTVENQTYWLTLLPIVTYHKLCFRGDAIKFNRGRTD